MHVGFGLVCPMNGGPPFADMHVADVNQEHGLIAAAESHEAMVERFPVGTRLRVLPNHACLTAAPYDRYYVVRGDNTEVVSVWTKCTGWASSG
jgi:D-serine deaminase-like pyridoxal phosphate-dependent protein